MFPLFPLKHPETKFLICRKAVRNHRAQCQSARGFAVILKGMNIGSNCRQKPPQNSWRFSGWEDGLTNDMVIWNHHEPFPGASNWFFGRTWRPSPCPRLTWEVGDASTIWQRASSQAWEDMQKWRERSVWLMHHRGWLAQSELSRFQIAIRATSPGRLQNPLTCV